MLTEINGYAEYVYVRRNPILRISDALDAAAAVALVLNYLVAYQFRTGEAASRLAIGFLSSSRRRDWHCPCSWAAGRSGRTVSTRRPSSPPWLGMASFHLTFE